MTQEALKLALEALKWCHGGEPCGTSEAITALKEALAEHAMQKVQRLGQEIEQEPVPNRLFLEKMLAAMEGVIDVADRKTDEFEALRSCVVDLTLMLHSTPQPERHELQAKGEHPAPCARHCEANAFQIVIKNLKAQLAQPEQKPVAWMDADGNVSDNNDHKCFPIPLYTTPPQRTWVGLTEQDLDYLCNLAYTGDEEFALAVQAKLMEKNA